MKRPRSKNDGIGTSWLAQLIQMSFDANSKPQAPTPSLVRLCRAAREGGRPPIPPLLRLRRAGRGGRRLVLMLSLCRVVAFEPATTEAAAGALYITDPASWISPQKRENVVIIIIIIIIIINHHHHQWTSSSSSCSCCSASPGRVHAVQPLLRCCFLSFPLFSCGLHGD